MACAGLPTVAKEVEGAREIRPWGLRRRQAMALEAGEDEER
jgi:hypothetical protein